MDKETALVMLGLQRDCLRDSLDPDAWRQLASEYESIGAESNAAACYMRAEHCAAQQWQTYKRRCEESA